MHHTPTAGCHTNTCIPNVGVDFLEKSLELGNGDTLKLLCWDTAGQEEFDALTSSYYRGALVNLMDRRTLLKCQVHRHFTG